ncbi:MAG TPA: DUF2231 domain-containing protein [Spirochaetia bacterium]|nr:DUF2231 domain-containing protein [Spirochaetia bacterium]
MNGLKLLGHPLHPAIVHFPVAGWTAALVTDALFVALRDQTWQQISLWLLVVGTVAGLGAMTAGFIDLVSLPSGQAAQKAALRHMYVMSLAWTVYAIDLLVHFLTVPSWTGLVLSLVGFVTLLVGTHLGAHLVYDLGVGSSPSRAS